MSTSSTRLSTKTLFPKRRTGAGGMTLLEVMIALFVISVMVLIFTASVTVAKRAAYQNGLYCQAISIAQHKIDQLRAHHYGGVWDAIANGANFTELNDGGIIADTPTTLRFALPNGTNHSEGYNDFADTDLYDPSGTINIAPVAGTTETVQVTVAVRWKSTPYSTKDSTLTVTGYITNAE